MDGIYKIKEWISIAISNVKKEGNVYTEHIDSFEIFFDEKDLIKSSAIIFNAIAKELNVLQTEGVSIYLSIELKEKSIYPTKKFDSLSQIYKAFNSNSMPEIIIYYAKNLEMIPFIELHRTPILINTFDFSSNINVFLKEDRSADDILMNRKLSREIIFVYNRV